MDQLSPEEIQRYSRHLILPEVGASGQLNLKNGSVLVVGAGGLGCPILLYLAAAGVGRIGIIDDDRVDLSNLQRQVMYTQADVGQPKAQVAAARLRALNPLVAVEVHQLRFSAANAADLVDQYDVIIDGTDNFATRYLVNDACVLRGKPNVHGAIYRFEGQASVFSHQGGPCYRCLFPTPPPPDAVPNCAEGGVLGVMAGTIGVLQATEALKILLGKPASLSGRLLIYDALTMTTETLMLRRDANCPICGLNPSIKSVVEAVVACAAVAQDLTPGQLQAQRQSVCLLDVRNPEEYQLGHIEGARHIPLAELAARLAELPRDQDIVVYCKSGGRSARAADLLLQQGFTNVHNLAGGITAWARDIDATMPVY